MARDAHLVLAVVPDQLLARDDAVDGAARRVGTVAHVAQQVELAARRVADGQRLFFFS